MDHIAVFKTSIFKAFRNYFNFSGRASRAEIVSVYGLLVLGIIILAVVGTVVGEGTSEMLITLFVSIMLIPLWSVYIRRMHDFDRSLISFYTKGGLRKLDLFTKDGTTGPNQYGQDPLNS